MFHRSACLPLSLCVIVVDFMFIARFFREENNKSLMRYTYTSVRLNLSYTQDREFTCVIIPNTAMVHLFLQFHVISQLITKVFFFLIYYKTITCILKMLENDIIHFTHFSTDPALQTDSVKMKEFHNINCE